MTAPQNDKTSSSTILKSVKVLSVKDAPQFRSSVLKLIDATFPKGSPTDRSTRVEEEFHLLLNTENSDRVLFVIDESLDKNSFPSWPVVATASYRPFEFHFKGRPIPLRGAGIGLVVTSPICQKKGYGHLIQAEIEARAHEKDRALFSVLWSDLVQFYSKLGYFPAGAEKQWQFDSLDLEKIESEMLKEKMKWEKFHILPLENFDRAKKLYEQLSIGPMRNFSLYDELLKLPNTFAYAAYERKIGALSPELKAYGIMGKARDLRDTFHEFIGDPLAFAPIFLELKKHTQSGMRFYHPAESPYLPKIESFLGPGVKNALSFFKVLDGPGIVEWLSSARYLGSGFGISGDTKGFQLLNRHITFFESPDFSHLLQLFFGPWKIAELEDLPSDLKNRAHTLPGPLPIYFWGLDSV